MPASIFRRFEGLIDPFRPYDASAPIPGELKKFYAMMLRPAWKPLALVTVFSAIVATAEMSVFYYIGRLVDILGEAQPATLWETYGGELALMAAVVLIVLPVAGAIATMAINQGYLTPMGAMIRWRTHRHVLRQSVSFFQNDFAGRIATKVLQTGPSMADSVYQSIDALLYAVIYVIGVAVIFAEVDGRLVWPLAIWFALYVAVASHFVPRTGKAAKEMSEARSRLNGRIVDSYTNIQTVKLFAHTDREDAYGREAIADAMEKFKLQMRLISRMEISLYLLNTLLMVGVMGLCVWLWTKNDITLGAIAATGALAMRLNFMTGWIMWSLANIFQNVGVAMEGLETISKPITLLDAPDAKPLVVTRGEIRYDHAHYMYGKEKGGIEEIDLTIRPGERIGLIGRSGAGKSTMVNLLLRFHDLESGRILIDGQSVAEVTQDSLRGQIAMVTQDTALLHRSVMDNILYGRPDAGEPAAIEAAKRAAAHEFILDLEDPTGRKGYDAHVGERGVKLSGGQRQRVAIARAILKDAPILVLDEATSALDSEVEAEIQAQLYALMEGKTVIAIAHRLSTVAQMDRLVVLDQGRIAEEGTHAELIARGGLYAGFWARQSGGFLGEVEDAETTDGAAA